MQLTYNRGSHPIREEDWCIEFTEHMIQEALFTPASRLPATLGGRRVQDLLCILRVRILHMNTTT